MNHPPRRSRRRVSRSRYLLRRVVAGTAAVALIVVLVWGLSSVLGGDGQPSAGSGPGRQGASGTSSTAPTTTLTVTTLATTTTTAPDRPPSAEHPAEVLVLGDSDAGTFGPYLARLLDETGVVEITVDYKVSSGLSRPDFFDWPAHIEATVPAADPDIIVVTFGGNDGQDIRDRDGDIVAAGPTGNEDAWTEEYVRRADEVLDLLEGDGRTVIWVGIPNDDNPDVTARMQVQDEAARAAVARHPGVTFVDTWARFSGRSGGWAEYVIDPRDREGKPVRASDGFHLNETGAEILALDIARVVEADLRARGATW